MLSKPTTHWTPLFAALQADRSSPLLRLTALLLAANSSNAEWNHPSSAVSAPLLATALAAAPPRSRSWRLESGEEYFGAHEAHTVKRDYSLHRQL
jgi:hypothetical protein